jgi:hypothetical protein
MAKIGSQLRLRAVKYGRYICSYVDAKGPPAFNGIFFNGTEKVFGNTDHERCVSGNNQSPNAQGICQGYNTMNQAVNLQDRKINALSELGEKIFLDRYAIKDAKKETLEDVGLVYEKLKSRSQVTTKNVYIAPIIKDLKIGGYVYLNVLAGNEGSGPDLFFYAGSICWNTWDGCANPFGSIPASASNGSFHHYACR